MFELVVSLLFLALSIAVAVMAKLLPVGLAPTFWVGAGAFPFILSVLLAIVSVWWSLDTIARIREEKKLQLAKKPWLDELLGNRTQKIHFVVICVAILIYVFALIPLCGGLTKEYGLRKKCVPVGMSCGGMFAVKFAAKYPEYISALYIDAPVLNLLSCPSALGISRANMWDEFHEATGISMSELICSREHPMDKLPILIQNDIPVVMVYGKDDTVVPYCENGAILEKYYNEYGGKLLAIGKDGCNHHPHGLENPQPIVDFIIHTVNG